MAPNRRQFLSSAAAIGGASTLLPLTSCKTGGARGIDLPDYSILDAALSKSVFRKDLFPDPVIIESLELLRDRDSTICRVRSKDGAEGISIGHPFIAKNSYPMFTNLLQNIFLGKDARDLDNLIYQATEDPIKNQGIPLNVQIAASNLPSWI